MEDSCMNLEPDPSIADGYTSKGYIAGLVTEAWATANLYCINCPSKKLTRERPNYPVRDFACPSCRVTYQLKAKNGRHGRTVSNSAYEQKINAIDHGNVPHYVLPDYSKASWKVTGLFVVPGHLIGRGVIQRLKPLGPHAKRAGWLWSNVLLGEIPEEGRIKIVTDGVIINPVDVRRNWEKVAFLRNNPKAAQGWGADVFARVKRLVLESGSREFTLQSFRLRFQTELSDLHPENQNTGAKIRQQMQVLRDGGCLSLSIIGGGTGFQIDQRG